MHKFSTTSGKVLWYDVNDNRISLWSPLLHKKTCPVINFSSPNTLEVDKITMPDFVEVFVKLINDLKRAMEQNEKRKQDELKALSRTAPVGGRKAVGPQLGAGDAQRGVLAELMKNLQAGPVQLKKVGPAACKLARAHCGRCGKPSGDCSTEVCTDNNTDRLIKRHRAGVYKTDDHNRRRGRGLNNRCYNETKQESLYRIGCELPEDVLKAGACALLQRIAHNLHTVQEQRKTAYQRKYVKYTHDN